VDERRRRILAAIMAGLTAMAATGCGSGGGNARPLQPADYDEDAVPEPAIDPANAGKIVGTITYRQRIAIPKGATIVVELFDISNPAAPTRISGNRFATESQVPIQFQLDYDRTRIDSARTYGVRARILVDRALWFVNDQPVPVLTRGNPSSIKILVRPASARE